MDLVLSLVCPVSGKCDWVWCMQALLTSHCSSTLLIVPSTVSDITLKLKRDVKIQTTNQPTDLQTLQELEKTNSFVYQKGVNIGSRQGEQQKGEEGC
ncbi:hypothetical protein ElyMa_002717700 [Elysia marginata]|uniref:Uncharacterized protein n=1 Tax=Elysia marginata TaxID=1093978 RepID=A0AAV4HDR0_9GAST|nr:hypothetical protein ElyMa_002717700 [Elysia marginata]